MIENSTQHTALVQYYYNETDLRDSDRIQRVIDGDPLVAGDYQELVKLMDQLTVQLAPSEDSIQRILAYAK